MSAVGMFLHPKKAVGVFLERVHVLFEKVLPLMDAVQAS